MAMKFLGKIGRSAPWLSLIVIVAACVFTLWWLKQQNPAVARVFGPAVAILVMGYALFITYRRQRRLDEVQIASQGFAHTHGSVGATFATVLLLMLPPVTNWLIDLVNVQSTGSPELSDRGAVRLGFIYGVCLVVVMQTLGSLVAAVIWWRRMGGMGERS
jgi:hypothetical protein